MPDTNAPELENTVQRQRRFRLDAIEHSARLTAIFAVLAAVASGQYALQVSHTTLAQAEATNEWGFYQAKSIKRNVAESRAETIHALIVLNPAASEQLTPMAAKAEAEATRYAGELDAIKANAEKLNEKKGLHDRQGGRFQYAFILLQAGVVLSTLGTSAKRKSLFFLALFAGVAGAAVAVSAYLMAM